VTAGQTDTTTTHGVMYSALVRSSPK